MKRAGREMLLFQGICSHLLCVFCFFAFLFFCFFVFLFFCFVCFVCRGNIIGEEQCGEEPTWITCLHSVFYVLFILQTSVNIAECILLLFCAKNDIANMIANRRQMTHFP